jgi:hypothetical protein
LISKSFSASLRKSFESIDWKILIFLLLFLNVKLVIKIISIALICLLNFNFKFGFRFRNSRLPLFYVVIIFIGIFNWIITSGFTNVNYNFAFLTGVTFWLVSIIALHQVKLSVEHHDSVVIDKTLKVFFIINAIVSLSVLLLIIYDTGHINPYLYQGEYQKYFIGTGDYIKGISFDTSTTNSVLNAIGVIYFLDKKNSAMVLLCMTVLLLTGSNITNLILCGVLAFIFILRSDKDQKSIIFICLFLLVIFMTKISPQNNQYLVISYDKLFNNAHSKNTSASTLFSIRQKPDNSLTPEERKQKFAMLYLDSMSRIQMERQKNKVHPFNEKPAIPGDSIHTPKFQHRSVITPVEENMFHFIITSAKTLPLSTDSNFHPKIPGKIIGLEQTIKWQKQHPRKILTGAGIGNFSSKLALRASGIKVAGSYPEKFKYISNDFLSNHLDLYLYYFSKEDKYHSIINSPASVYDQLLSEYGLAGLFAFFIFYIGFFLKNFKKLTYGIPLILLLSGIFFIDYWLEQLSVVVLFELLLFLNIKERTQSL